jgi:hypothetical protein
VPSCQCRFPLGDSVDQAHELFAWHAKMPDIIPENCGNAKHQDRRSPKAVAKQRIHRQRRARVVPARAQHLIRARCYRCHRSKTSCLLEPLAATPVVRNALGYPVDILDPRTLSLLSPFERPRSANTLHIVRRRHHRTGSITAPIPHRASPGEALQASAMVY